MIVLCAQSQNCTIVDIVTEGEKQRDREGGGGGGRGTVIVIFNQPDTISTRESINIPWHLTRV